MTIFIRTAWPGQSIGRPILGPPENISRFTRDDIQRYIESHYLADKLVIVAAGKVDHTDFVSLVEEWFNQIPSGAPGAPESPCYQGGQYWHNRPFEQVQLMMGGQGVSYYNEDYRPMQLWSVMLGGGMASRLFQEVREKRGLAYSIYSFTLSYADMGMFGIAAGTNAEQVPELVNVITGELEGIAGHISEEELARAKTQLRSSLFMSAESTEIMAETVGRHVLVHGRFIPAEEILKRAEAITIKDIDRIIEARGFDQLSCFSAVGPVETLENMSVVSASKAA